MEQVHLIINHKSANLLHLYHLYCLLIRSISQSKENNLILKIEMILVYEALRVKFQVQVLRE
jgi:hypothetical protein